MHNYLSAYLAQTEKAIQNLECGYIERYEEEILTSTRMNLRIRIRFENNELLEFNEAVTENNVGSVYPKPSIPEVIEEASNRLKTYI